MDRPPASLAEPFRPTVFTTSLLSLIATYLALGALFGVAFVFAGAARLNEPAAHTPLRVRLIFYPGAVALWPLLLSKWMRSGKPQPVAASAANSLIARHAMIWLSFGPLLIVVLVAFLLLRPTPLVPSHLINPSSTEVQP